MKASELLEGDANIQSALIANLRNESPAFLSGKVAERLAALPSAANEVKQACRASFETAIAALSHEGFAPLRKQSARARRGDTKALTRIADDARLFHEARGLDVPSEIIAAADVLAALAVFLTVDREPVPKTLEAYDEWMARRDAALYAFAAADLAFQRINLDILDLAGQRLEGKSKRMAAGKNSGAKRRRDSKCSQARADFKLAREKNPRLTPSSFAEHHHEDYGCTTRAVQKWLSGL